MMIRARGLESALKMVELLAKINFLNAANVPPNKVIYRYIR